jgi:orotidine 5'-phosphate decarboxylase subfamily 2
MLFNKKLNKIVKKNNSLLCIGLDSDWNKIPQHLRKKKNPLFLFNKQIIDTTYDLVCAYKPNSAFYEAEGEAGIKQLKMSCDYLHKKYPAVSIILDAKRADIGNTNEGYVTYAFDYLGVDAITLHPYLGREAIEPFLKRKDKGCIILCRTSNKGAGEFQDLLINKKPLYKIIAENVIKKWNRNNNCLLVVGATYPRELSGVRKIVGNMYILVPGVGAQGGDLKATLKSGLTKDKKGLIISVSRSVIFAKNIRDEAVKLKDEINKYR